MFCAADRAWNREFCECLTNVRKKEKNPKKKLFKWNYLTPQRVLFISTLNIDFINITTTTDTFTSPWVVFYEFISGGRYNTCVVSNQCELSFYCHSCGWSLDQIEWSAVHRDWLRDLCAVLRNRFFCACFIGCTIQIVCTLSYRWVAPATEGGGVYECEDEAGRRKVSVKFVL